MAVRRGGFRPVAIALVVQQDDGSLTMIGSKQVNAAEISMEWDTGSYADDRDYMRHYHIDQTPTVRIEAECYGATMYTSYSTPTPLHLEQRGIYLPDMSFRALPGPGETS